MIQLIPVADYDCPGVWMEVLMAKQVSFAGTPDAAEVWGAKLSENGHQSEMAGAFFLRIFQCSENCGIIGKVLISDKCTSIKEIRWMNSIELKTLNELQQYAFYIPAYQRGYRWTSQEVNDLLNDIYEFIPREINETEDRTWYCLQPIVVKNRNGQEYEVIDGQQRLTTVYLVLYYLNQDFVEKRRDKLFSIDYETRPESKVFLGHPENKNNVCIDFFYMHRAYRAIENWFEKKEEETSFDKNEYRSKLKFHTKVIWYETTEDNPVTVFTRLNIGKISLTNAELIKALFLNSSNFRFRDEDRMRLRQIEIANEWDNIESSLQNNKLWYFLSDKQKEDNRRPFYAAVPWPGLNRIRRSLLL